MAKVKTKKDLENEIEELKTEIQYRDRRIGELESDVSNSKHRYDALIEDTGNTLLIGYEQATNHFPGTVNGLRLKQHAITAIFTRIGRLLSIEQEYYDLKDRTLDLPKTKILDAEINQHRK